MNNRILAIDPGPEQSAWMDFNCQTQVIWGMGITPNEEFVYDLPSIEDIYPMGAMVVEMVAHYGTGMPAGKTVFDTCVWIGRFIQAWQGPHQLIYRPDIKLHLCGHRNAKDSNIRQALIDRFGPGKDKAIGTKKNPGPLYGVKKDIWSALAVAVTYADQQKQLIGGGDDNKRGPGKRD